MATKTKTKPKAKKPAAKKPAPKPALKPAAKSSAKAAPKPPPSAPSLKPLGFVPMNTAQQQTAVKNLKQFFDRTIACLDEADAAFTPSTGMFSTAQQIAHAAQTTDWFLDGAFSPAGFNMDFPGMEAEVRRVTSLAQAKQWLERSIERLLKALREKPASEWYVLLPKDQIMGGAPRAAIVDGLVDHTAHHRGSLAVYARLRGKTPAMPYM